MGRTQKREKDQLDQILDQIDFSSLTQEELLGEGGLMRQLTSRLLNKALEAEMNTHLGYEKYSTEGYNSGNSRNGYSDKSVLTESGEAKIQVPRDRNGEFSPRIVPKHSKRSPLFNDQIIALYGKGMSTRDIQKYLEEIYGVEVSPELISNVTDAVVEDVRAWRTRLLERQYAVVFLDAIIVNSRQEGKSQKKALNIALGIRMDGKKEVLGMYLAENEGAKFWMSVLTDLKNRGVEDILIACMDGLTGFPEAVRAVFPQTAVQLCIVHMIRSSTKFVNYKDRKTLCKDLKAIYGAPSEEEALSALDDFGEKWNDKYPTIQKSWKAHWNDLNEFFSYPEELRRVIYTTNAIESLNYSLRKVTKTRSAFPTDEAIYKIMYLAINDASKKWTLPIKNWGQILNQLYVIFGDRVKV